MPHPRSLSPDQLIAARWEYEQTGISLRALALKWNWSRTAISETIASQGWARAAEQRTYVGPEGAKQFKLDVAAAIKAARNGKLIEGLSRPRERPLLMKPPAEPDQTIPDPGPAPRPADRPPASQTPSEAPDSQPASTGTVVSFPGAYAAPGAKPTAPSSVFPPRSKTEQAAQRVQLAILRGELTLKQLQMLDDHDQLLDDYHHLLSVGMNPGRFIDVSGLPEEAANEQLRATSAAALRMALPTERDTLAAAVIALNRARLATITAKRVVAGIAIGRGKGGDRDDDEPTRDPAIGLDTAELRDVRRSMALLTGNTQRNSEPPKPPPPEGLDDLVVVRPPQEKPPDAR